MLGANAEANKLPRVPEFYYGKSIFITGATGFIGSVLLEVLLRCCPGIKYIYILLRMKKNVLPEVRKQQIFNKKIFEKIREKTPKMLEKVSVISGDISQPNLGMNEDDTHLLLQEVSIVFHCAALLSFMKPVEISIKNNVLSLNAVIGLCRKMRKFEALVYTSTAYSNCNHLNFPIREEVYRLPFHAGQFLDALKNEDKDQLQALVAHCKPDWPNSYSFSKCLAENVIADTASDLPIAIIRPSIVFCTWKHPIPGYSEENDLIATFSLGIGKGFIKVLHGDPNCEKNVVPVDIVANAHVLAAWSVGTKRCASPLVANCTASENLLPNIDECMKNVTQLAHEFPLPQSFMQHTNPIIVPNKYLYCILAAYHHYIPAIVLDVILRILGRNARMYSLYRAFDSRMRAFNFFMFYSFKFERNNLEYLDKLIHPEDRKILTLDFKDATLREMMLLLPGVSSFYDWKKDKKSQRERQRIKYKYVLLLSYFLL